MTDFDDWFVINNDDKDPTWEVCDIPETISYSQ